MPMRSCAKKKLSFVMIPNGESEHAAQPLQKPAPLFVTVQQNFGIRFCPEMMPRGLQLPAQFHKIINLAIKDHHQRTIFVEHRLLTSFKIDDFQAAMAQPNVLVNIISFAIRPTMAQHISHPLYQFRRHRIAGGNVEFSTNTAHEVCGLNCLEVGFFILLAKTVNRDDKKIVQKIFEVLAQDERKSPVGFPPILPGFRSQLIWNLHRNQLYFGIRTAILHCLHRAAQMETTRDDHQFFDLQPLNEFRQCHCFAQGPELAFGNPKGAGGRQRHMYKKVSLEVRCSFNKIEQTAVILEAQLEEVPPLEPADAENEPASISLMIQFQPISFAFGPAREKKMQSAFNGLTPTFNKS